MAKYFRVTIGTSLQSTFSIKYSTTGNSSVYDHTADIYNLSNNTYSTATNVSYNQLTDNGGAIVRTDNDVYKLTIIDQNGHCSNCTSEAYGTISNPSNPATTSNVYIYNYVSNSGGSSFPVWYGAGTNNEWSAGSDVTDGQGSGKVSGVQNNSSDDLYIRLKAFTYTSGTYYPDGVAEIVYDGDGRNTFTGGAKQQLYIGTFGGSQNIYPGSGAMTSSSPQYSGMNYWRLGPNKAIAFGIHPGYYNSTSRVSQIKYTLAFSTSVSVSSTQTEITQYVT